MHKFVLLVSVSLCLAVPSLAEAAKKKPGSNATPSAEQRKRAYENGLKSCRKKFGAQLHFVRVEKFYGKWGVVCYHY